MINIELFSGSGGFQKVSRSLGVECLTLDNRRRKGTCEPDLKIDILKVPGTFFKSMDVFCAWIGLPCDIWSNASGGFHLDGNFNPLTVKAVTHLEILEKTMQLIEESNFKYWFIENPNGKLKNYPGLKNFLKKHDAVIYEITLSSYGFPTTKPTIIISNFHGLEVKKKDAFGRGAKCSQDFNKMTKVQRQKTPELLYRSILKQVLNESKFHK